MTDATPGRLVVYTREGCGLCDEMIADLGALLAGTGLQVSVVDVDAEAGTRSRYGLKVPVLELDGQPLCSGHLDPDVLDGVLPARG